jgi:hypothetical protein
VEEFGPIQSGERSAYRAVKKSYRYAYTIAASGQRIYILQPIDFVGESLLPPGSYTFRFTAVELDVPMVQEDYVVHGLISGWLSSDDILE